MLPRINAIIRYPTPNLFVILPEISKPMSTERVAKNFIIGPIPIVFGPDIMKRAIVMVIKPKNPALNPRRRYSAIIGTATKSMFIPQGVLTFKGSISKIILSATIIDVNATSFALLIFTSRFNFETIFLNICSIIGTSEK
ncbi:139aa long hypothetical protein [Pyrococcus horikoshii OT3]|uniref:Uncharacterized protein n=1 Tax=Pyrococcus horikoshii (strain ATCC 700860 / DSM 12428 / JCM 9974 / NBRC 100139 / OT-3) TaxID=70601 RepID=O57990_PYRHO|nr:139aa long hypothetical protein [Pyrococcus horikoshii OT3]